MNILTSFLYILLFVGCLSNTNIEKQKLPNSIMKNIITDSIAPPEGMSENANLLNLGSKEEPILAWVDYMGTFRRNGKNYSHIHGIRYCYLSDNQSDTIYYENLELRKGLKEFNFIGCKIPDQVTGQGDMTIVNDKDTITMFNVLEKVTLKSKVDGIEYRKPYSIKFNDNKEVIYADDIRVNISKKDINKFIVSFIDDDLIGIAYGMNNNFDIEKELISFVNREDGKIYFTNKDYFLYPLNSQDVIKLK